MEWSELDNRAKPTSWTLPAERAKNGRSHTIHLSDAARAILASVPRIKDNPYVFTGRGGKPIDNDSHIRDDINAKITELRQEAGIEPTALEPWTWHDFRRSGVTYMASVGIAPHVADKILNHITGTIQGVAAVYQKFQYSEERQRALDAWAAAILGAADGRPVPENVVPIRPNEAA